jgi:hypothetical protein
MTTRRSVSFILAVALCHGLSAHPQAASQTGKSAPNGGTVINTYFGTAAKAPPAACHAKFAYEAGQAVANKSPIPLIDFLSFNTDPACATYLLLSSKQVQQVQASLGAKTVAAIEQQIEQLAAKQVKAMSQQNGSSSGSGGSTNLTSKGLSAKILSIASEYGALTESVSNQTTTVQGSFAGVPLVLMSKGYIAECSTRILAVTPCFSHGFMSQLSKFSYSVSFATDPSSATITGKAAGSSAGSSQQVTLQGSDRSINALSVKWVAMRSRLDEAALQKAAAAVSATDAGKSLRDAQSAMTQLETQKVIDWESALAQTLLQLIQKGSGSSEAVDKAYNTWRTAGDAMAASFELPDHLDQSGVSPSERQTVTGVATLARAYTQYLGVEEDQGLSAEIAQPPALSIEYDDNRPPSQPSNSVFRAIYQDKLKPLTLTVNGACSIYNSNQSNVPGAGRLRDVQFASEAAHTFAVTTPLSSDLGVTLSGAFYFQYQSSPAILNVTPGTPVDGVTFTGLPNTATQVYAEKGNIAIGQLKLSVGSGSNVTVPLSVTYANRTELISNPTWKAQIGVSYDFDSLFSSAK